MRKSYSRVRELAVWNIENLFECAIDAMYGKNSVRASEWLKDVKRILWFAYNTDIISEHEYKYLERAIDAIVWG